MKIYEFMEISVLKARLEIREILSKKKMGGGEILAGALLLIIVIALALLFQDKIVAWFNKITAAGDTHVDNVIKGM